MFATTARRTAAPPAFSVLHKKYVQDLYRRFLRNSLDWNIQRNLWRADAQRIRAEFESHRHEKNPRALATILNHAEEMLAHRKHPDPYKRVFPRVRAVCSPRSYDPRMFSDEEKTESLKDQHV
ncbi:hypothetical protein MSPP1_002924 [Malassezia sp. CBS 17886]|nr:hypothetical protein MSPP1_002924 [Malassezia sp. CBS 17886]